ncbi:MAG: 3-phosphoshikimate 1-carboxyvinyltransferase [Oscillospiraceae bacterium]|nr:3-phosphoshikimate 1-carboxyvinyltransferase [Oscillospiraceae bacterium]
MKTFLIDRFPAGLVRPPSSKSMGHRAVICAALAEEDSVISRISLSEDIQATLDGVAALGASWRLSGDTLHITGRSQNADRRRYDAIDCGESGSTLRFLIPIAALDARQTTFTGRRRLFRRPLEAYARVFAERNLLFQPIQEGLRVAGPLVGGPIALPGDVSSQFVSGLLFALPLCREASDLRLTTPLESAPYVTLTLDAMRRFGVAVEEVREGGRHHYHIPGGQCYRACALTLEADYSQAAFFLAAAALGCSVRCAGLSPDSHQGDRAMLDILRDMGAEVIWEGGLVSVRADRLRPVTVDVRAIPDLTPPIATLCCFCEGTSRIVNAGRLRLKESDRLGALAAELGKLGADIQEGPDSLTIRGKPSLPGGEADAQGDHRIAMAVAVAAIRCQGPVTLTGADSVNKSYPRFWDDFLVAPTAPS